MSKRAEEAALEAYPKQDMYSAWIDGSNRLKREVFIQGYEQAERDIAKALLAEYKKQYDKCPDADYEHDYTVTETQQYGRFMMMESIYEKFCEPVGITLDDLEEEK